MCGLNQLIVVVLLPSEGTVFGFNTLAVMNVSILRAISIKLFEENSIESFSKIN